MYFMVSVCGDAGKGWLSQRYKAYLLEFFKVITSIYLCFLFC